MPLNFRHIHVYVVASASVPSKVKQFSFKHNDITVICYGTDKTNKEYQEFVLLFR
jgi:hypothetical protein